MSKYRYGVELYSVKDELARDLPGTLKKVKAMGYGGVEFFGGFTHSAADVKKAMDEAGVVCCGWHTPWSYVQEDMIDATVEYFKAIGNKYVIIPGMPDELTATIEASIQTAGLYNKIAAKLASHSMRLGYHNHASELHFYPGTTQCPFTAFFDHTDPSIIVQMDNGHVINGRGIGILSLLRRYPNRYTTVHLKPYSLEKGAVEANDGYNSMIGQDDVPWMEFMSICRTTGGTEWFIVEYESAEMYPELEGVDICLKVLKDMEASGII
jgi:sugar phosphate isomerase/epimerase